MPLLLTRGYGSQGDGTGSGLASTNGLGDPGAAIIGGTFALLLVEVYEDRLEAVFSVPVQAIGAAADPTQWVVTTLVSGAPVPVASSVVVAGPRIKIYMSEAREGVLYTLNLPVFGIKDLSNNPYTGPFTYDYLAVGLEPFVALAGAQDGYHVKVIFSEPVQTAEALVPSNYVITGGGGLSVYEVTQETAQTYILRTSLQTVGQTYTVTVSNVKDLVGNLI